MKNELWSKGYSFIEQDLELYKAVLFEDRLCLGHICM